MTVKELIEKLRQIPEDAKITYQYYESDTCSYLITDTVDYVELCEDGTVNLN